MEVCGLFVFDTWSGYNTLIFAIVNTTMQNLLWQFPMLCPSKPELDLLCYGAVYFIHDKCLFTGIPFATGTGTLVLQLLDVNDNGPVPSPRAFTICSRNPEPYEFTISDADLPPNTYPYEVELSHGSDMTWTAEMRGTSK